MTGPEDVMFSPAVKAEQMRLGSRVMFEDREWNSEITDDLRQFLAVIDTFFLATASADGQPYIQHRGGPPGFLKTIGTNTLAFADFAGNRQYITLGHLKENDRAHIFIPHFATRQRVKLWGRARVVEGDLELILAALLKRVPAAILDENAQFILAGETPDRDHRALRGGGVDHAAVRNLGQAPVAALRSLGRSERGRSRREQ